MDRRGFLKCAAALGAGAFAWGCQAARPSGVARASRPWPPTTPPSPSAGQAQAAQTDGHFVRQAQHYTRLGGRRVRCEICPKKCEVGDRERGFCGARENHAGAYHTLVYGRACSVNIDPVEKKPFFHFLPGSLALSFAAAGCNLACKNCQNWEISQVRPEQVEAAWMPPERLAAEARARRIPIVAGTYSEPVTFFEYMDATAVEGRKQGVRTVMISAGFINPEPMKQLCAHLDAIKIDLKSMRNAFYRDNCAGELQPVLDAIEVAHRHARWLEVVYLVIPTLNDKVAEVRDCARWMKRHVGPDVPLHFTRFQPMYRLKNLPPTPTETLVRCRNAALAEGLHYVYTGNVPGDPGENTYCHHCGKMLIERRGYEVRRNEITGGKCRFCATPIPGIWS